MMNNEAFRALVAANNNHINNNNNRNHDDRRRRNANNGSEKSSTKEIAREAVEHEFQNKHRRHRRGHHGGGGGAKGRGRFHGRQDDDDDRAAAAAARSDDGGSSSNDDDVGRNSWKKQKQQPQLSSNDNEPDWKKRRRRENTLQDDGSDGIGSARGSVEYRDRAKERRMGNNLDYDATLDTLATDPLSSLLIGGQGGVGKSDEERKNHRRKQEELSKYLGGDLDHTHLVKGLDKALAEKVRREEMTIVREANDDEDLDAVLENAQVNNQQPSSHLQEGRRVDWKSIQPKTELGKSMLTYLLQKQLSYFTVSSPSSSSTVLASMIPAPPLPTTSSARNLPAVQKSIHRSLLTFSLNSDVRQREKAWEVPRMSMKAAGAVIKRNNEGEMRMAPLNNQMIAAISKKLDGRRGGTSSSHSQNKTQKYGSSSSHADMNEHEKNVRKESAGAKTVGTTTTSARLMKSHAEDDDGDDDSDDDIFANVGNYLPPQRVSTLTAIISPALPSLANDNTCNSTQEGDTKNEMKKRSIFDNLIPNANSSTNVQTHDTTKHVQIMVAHPQQGRHQSHHLTENCNVIDRDIFGGGESLSSQLPYQRRRGPQVAAMDGVSMAAYRGGYGEDLDVDFGGHDDDHDHDEDGGKKSEKQRRGRIGGMGDNAADID